MSSDPLVRFGQTNPRDNARLKYEAPVVEQLSVGGHTALTKSPGPGEGTFFYVDSDVTIYYGPLTPSGS